jgi:hypothetical protein
VSLIHLAPDPGGGSARSMAAFAFEAAALDARFHWQKKE